jgi:hypothetical protein
MTQTMDRGFPQRVVKFFPGISLRVDAAFQREGKHGWLSCEGAWQSVLNAEGASTRP